MRRSLLFLALVVVFSSTMQAECKDNVVGTWKLLSVTATFANHKAVQGINLCRLSASNVLRPGSSEHLKPGVRNFS